LLGKPILESDIFPLNPSKLTQLFAECFQEARYTGSCARIKETHAEDFSCLLRLGNDCNSKQYHYEQD